MAKNNNKVNNIMKELTNGFFIEDEATVAGAIAMTILEEEDLKLKPNKFGDCSLCKMNSCEGCKYYI